MTFREIPRLNNRDSYAMNYHYVGTLFSEVIIPFTNIKTI